MCYVVLGPKLLCHRLLASLFMQCLDEALEVSVRIMMSIPREDLVVRGVHALVAPLTCYV
jgi:hypothetical protein